jgi:hypothetical protein
MATLRGQSACPGNSDRPLSERPHWSQRYGTIFLVPDSCTPSPGPGTLLPIQGGMIVPSAWLADMLLTAFGGQERGWAGGG